MTSQLNTNQRQDQVNQGYRASPPKTIEFFEMKINRQFIKKYSISDSYYNIRIINEIIFNEKSHLVSLFKNYLIADDGTEFLKRFYRKKESAVRLPRFFTYYETYSKIFPNYTSLRESKFIYKNIHKKQKMIDLQQEKSKEDKNNKEKRKEKESNKDSEDEDDNKRALEVFSTEVYNSIVNDNEDIAMIFDLKSDQEDIEYKVDELINKISLLEVQNEVAIDCLLKKVPVTPQERNFLDCNCSSSKLFPLNEALSKNINQYYQNKCPKFHQNNKQSIESTNSSNDHIMLNKLRNEKIKAGSLHQLSPSSLPQATPKYSQRPMTYRDGSLNDIEKSDKVEDNHIESNQVNSNKPIIRFKLQSNPELLEANKLKENLISQIKGNHRLYFQSKIIEGQYEQNFRKVMNSNDQQNQLSPLISTQKASILKGKRITYRNSQLGSQLPSTDRLLSINKNINSNMFSLVIPRKPAIKGKGHDSNHNSQEKDHTVVNSRSTNQLAQQAKRDNTPNMKQTRCKYIMNNKGRVLAPWNHLAVSSSIKQLPIQQRVKGLQIKDFGKALGLIETPMKKTNSDRLIKSILR